MRIVTFLRPDRAAVAGALIDADRDILDLELATGSAVFATVQGLIEAGPDAWAEARAAVAAAPARALRPRVGTTLLSPLPVPVQLRDFASFEGHSSVGGKRTLPRVWYDQPVYYKCNRFAVAGPDSIVDWPAHSQSIDYELELAVVIGIGGKDIPAERAMDHLFGYTIFNDLSARDWQFREMEVGLGPARGKDFDGANVLGPCIVTADEVPDPYALCMAARVNGEEWSRGSVGTIHHRIDRMISFASESQTLHAGEIFGTGTVGGGCGFELGRYLARGDVIELEIDRIGLLRTRIR